MLSYLVRRRRIRLRGPSKPRRLRPWSFLAPEPLDLRLLPSAVTLLSATTADSKGVTISYELDGSGDPTLTFGVYRSASAAYNAESESVGTPLTLPLIDSSGVSATAPGVHVVTIPIPGGLPINPEHPYVMVVANPGSASAGQAGTVASFRKGSIAVVTHGGLQDASSRKHGPPWEQEMARSLRQEGYDRVIAYNWAAQSGTPGMAARQAPRLTRMVLRAVDGLPAGEPVDLQFIGHSEGAVVNTRAIVRVERSARPGVQAGYLLDTLLDPHAANPDFPGRQYSTGGPLGWVAKLAIDHYQARARDPLVFVPAGVDAAQVFYQQTPANRDHGTNAGIYNLWGQVPVKGAAVYYNLTEAGVVHSGKQGVPAWYERHVVPSLGDGAPGLAATTLTATPKGPAVAGRRATYSGTAEPGAAVRLTAGQGHGPLHLVARTIVGADGTWMATTRPLDPGTYRVIAEAKPARWSYARGQAIPTDPLGALVIEGG